LRCDHAGLLSVSDEQSDEALNFKATINKKSVFIPAKVDTHEMEDARYLQFYGFYIVGTRITLQMRAIPNSDKNDLENTIVGDAQEDHREILVRLARNGFKFSHCHLHSNIPRKLATKARQTPLLG